MKFPRKLICLIVICISLSVSAFGQADHPVRQGFVVPTALRFKLDSLSIMPGTFHSEELNDSQYRLDCITAEIVLLDSTLLGQPLNYSYQVYDMDFSKPFSHRSLELIESPPHDFAPVFSNLRAMSDLDDSQLVSSGSIYRGVTVGNNQDLVLNSGLDLQISGKLTEDIEIVASISDKNIPIQPEGNTEYLSNINNVFITLLYKKTLRIDAGDVMLTSPYDNFLKVNRSFLGMSGVVNTAFKNGKTTHSVGGGVAKGKFVRQTITPSNGVQGPYKLYGEGMETNIVVVAGSERVYVDGNLLTRGQDNDYVIDYNTAELTFTPAMLMTAEKRVIVEFECTDRHYSRYNIFSFNEIELGKKHPVKLNVNYYQEQDMKNHSIQPELNNEQKLFLSTLGDDVSQAFFPNVDSSIYSPDRVQYRRKDTIWDGVSYEIYEYSTNDSIQLFNVGFTYVGNNKGFYRLLSSTANGRVFGWVPPEHGVPQGEYEPVMQLRAPQVIRLATISAEYRPKPKTFVRTELAMSSQDLNTFSKDDDHNNVGFAAFVSAGHQQFLRKQDVDTSGWRLQAAMQWQFLHKNFRTVESFREVEFARNYNLASDFVDDRSEQLLQATIALSKPRISITRYGVNWLTRLGNLNALRQELFSHNEPGNMLAHTQTFWLLSSDPVQKSSFITSNNQLAYRWKKIELGVTDLLEHNIFRDVLTDSMRLNSYAFNEATAYLQSRDSSLYRYHISYKNRLEFKPMDLGLQLSMRIHEANAAFSFDRIKNQHFGARATYRNQQLRDSMGLFESEHYYVGNLEYSGRFWKNALMLSTYYEVGNGMELRKTYTFIKVAAGQGTHVWRDYNHNGVEELDEFEVAAFHDEADYVKIWLNGTDYVNTYNTQFSQSIQLRPSAVWKNQTGLRKFLARFSNITMLRSQVKESAPVFNPFPAHLEDTALVSRNLTLNNTFSFNNSSSKFAFDFIVQKNNNKNLLYYGSEYNILDLQEVVLKSTPYKAVFLQVTYLHQRTRNLSEAMTNRCYAIEQHGAGGNVQIQFANSYFVSADYNFSAKKNHEGPERVLAHDVKVAFQYKMLKRGIVSASVQYVGLRGEAQEQNAVSYLMLNGLSLGENVLWSLNAQISITDFLQVALQYEGRKSVSNRAIHTGGLSLKAHF